MLLCGGIFRKSGHRNRGIEVGPEKKSVREYLYV